MKQNSQVTAPQHNKKVAKSDAVREIKALRTTGRDKAASLCDCCCCCTRR